MTNGNHNYCWLKVGDQLILQRLDLNQTDDVQEKDFGYAVLTKYQIKFFKSSSSYTAKLKPRVVGFDDDSDKWLDNMDDEAAPLS